MLIDQLVEHKVNVPKDLISLLGQYPVWSSSCKRQLHASTSKRAASLGHRLRPLTILSHKMCVEF
jgi:hypothetical protein